MEDLTLTNEALEAGLIEEPPHPISHGPVDWVKQNLVSSPGNTVLTLVFVLVSLGAIQWIFGIAFTESWDSVLTNMRLLFSYNYPAEQYIRVWFSLGMLLAAIGSSAAIWNLRPRLSLSSATSTLVGLGILFLLIAMLAPATDSDGNFITEDDSGSDSAAVVGVLKGIFSPILALHSPLQHIYFTIAALIAFGLAAIAWFSSDSPNETYISFEAMLVGFAASVVATVWLVRFGRHEFADGEFTSSPGTVNSSTKRPWTIMMAILLAAYFGGRLVVKSEVLKKRVGAFLALWWFAGPAFLLFLVLRDPAFDSDHLLSTDIPMALAFILLGGAILYYLTNPALGERALQIGAGLLLFAALTWVFAFFGWWQVGTEVPYFGNIAIWPMLQKARISFLLLAVFALLAPTFAGERQARLRYATYWAGTMFLVHWLITGINTPSTLDIAAPPFLGGFTLTLVVFYYVMIVSFPLGVLLALGRTSKMPIFRMMSTIYIEFVRGVPLITILIFFSVIVPLFLPGEMGLSELAAIFLGYSLFSAAYLAENVRGGLQSIRRGQYEASDALGLTTLQRTLFIVLPQALRVTIPNLVGQSIATFKETSLIAIIGGFDFLRVANSSIPAQSEFLGQKEAGLLFICFVYWIFAYSMSKASQNLERQLGVGQR